MGSFNVVCSVSRIPILEGEEAAIIILTKNEYYNSKKTRHTCYPYDFMRPAALPVFGKYQDAGKFTDMERDLNVTLLEKFFERPIENIVSDFKSEKRTKRKTPSGISYSPDYVYMYVRREIYDEMIKGLPGPRSKWDPRLLRDTLLEDRVDILERSIENSIKLHKDKMDMFSCLWFLNHLESFIPNYTNIDIFDKIYLKDIRVNFINKYKDMDNFDKIDLQGLREQYHERFRMFSDMDIFNEMLVATNNMYMPTQCGTGQCCWDVGHDYHLTKKIIGIMEERIKFLKEEKDE